MNENSLVGRQVQGYQIVKKLGSGGYGTVYLGEKEDLGKTYQTAIKHIAMPDAEGYEAVLQDYGYDKAAAQEHFEKMVEGITSEINTLLNLSKKDNRYIVAYYDHDIQKSYNPLRFEIFMRMEYLTPLNRHIRQNGITLGEVLKLGFHMCDALTLCHNNGVMHRDIKEANIFINDSGNFKLGDFGVAKVAIETTKAGSIAGTASYMAPEIYHREPYDTSVDIYSLGIVLYKLLNHQRLPFMPEAPAAFTVDDKNLAETRRLRGDTPPLPLNAKNELGKIIVKACSVKEVRYTKAEELKAAMQQYLKTLTTSEYDRVVIEPTVGADEDNNSVEMDSVKSYAQTQGATMTMGAQSAEHITPPSQENPYAEKKPKKKKKLIKPLLIGIVLLAAGVGGYLVYAKLTDPVNQFQTAVMESNFTEAGLLYQKEIKSGGSGQMAETKEFLVTYAGDVRDKYYAEELAYEDALNQLQEMGKLGVVSSEELQPTISEVNEMRTSRAAYENAQGNIEVGDYASAIGELRKVIQSDTNYSQAQTQLADSIRSYKEEVFVQISEYETEQNYQDAIFELRAGLQVVPDDADFLEKIKDYEKKISDQIELEVAGVIQSANDAAANNGEYQSALEELRAVLKKYPNNEDLKYAIEDVETLYMDAVFAEADGLAEEGEHDEAVALLNDLKAEMSDKKPVTEKISQINELRPIDLSQVVVIDSKDYNYKPDLFTDSFGNSYDGRHYFDARVKGYAVFNLEGKYSNFSGTIVAHQSTASDSEMELAIYVDDKMIYSKTGFNKRTGAIDFSVDVRGATKLEIKSGKSAGYWDSNLSIVNARLSR